MTDLGLKRCPWPGEDALYVAYHDEEWGVPEYDDRALYEKLMLDGFQAGLSWITILRKRENFRRAFDGFVPEKIARYRPAKVERLMQDAGIVRNRAKIEGTVLSARAWLEIMDKGPGFSKLLWDFVDGRPKVNHFQEAAARCRPRPRSRRRCRRNWPSAVSSSAARPSSMPSCRRSAWSTTISSAAIATRLAPSSGGRAWLKARLTSGLVRQGAAGEAALGSGRAHGRAWQRMLSGRRLDLLDPSPLDIEIEDIAHGLARVARWNGQTSGAHIFSVAQHCLLVEALARARAPRLDNSRRSTVLLHDAPEYVIGDMISPFKAVIGDAYKVTERRLLTAIHLRFGAAGQIGARDRGADQSRRPAGGLSRSDTAGRIRSRRGSEILRPATGILGGDGARLPQTLARRNRGDAFYRTDQKVDRRISHTCAACNFYYSVRSGGPKRRPQRAKEKQET